MTMAVLTDRDSALARSLCDKAFALLDAERIEDAVAPARAAVALALRCVADGRTEAELVLARAVRVLAYAATSTGRPELTVEAIAQSTDTYRRLATAEPEAFGHAFARELLTYSRLLRAIDPPASAAAVAEAVAAWHQCGTTGRQRLGGELAGRLRQLSRGRV